MDGDPGYDDARAVWNAMVDRRPRAIVRCASAGDVAEAIRYGRERDLELGVRCGGHSVLGPRVPDGGLMIDLTPMGGVRVDPGAPSRLGAGRRAARRARSRRAGARADHDRGQRVAHRRRRTHARRRHGLARPPARADLRQRRRATSWSPPRATGSASTSAAIPELFWGLRGGGGNFGVVTEFEFRLHPVGPPGPRRRALPPVERAAPVLRGWRDLNAIAPRAATFTAWVGESQSPALPPEWRGRPVGRVGFVWVGEPELEPQLLPALRALGRPVGERVEELSYLRAPADGRHARGPRAAPLLEGPLLPVAAGRGDRRVPAARHGRRPRRAAAARPRCRPTAARSPRCRTPTARSASATRPSSSSPPRAGPTRRGRGADGRRTALRRDARAVRQRHVRQRDERRGRRRRRPRLPAGEARPAHARSRTAYDPDNVFHLNQNIAPA